MKTIVLNEVNASNLTILSFLLDSICIHPSQCMHSVAFIGAEFMCCQQEPLDCYNKFILYATQNCALTDQQ